MTPRLIVGFYFIFAFWGAVTKHTMYGKLLVAHGLRHVHSRFKTCNVRNTERQGGNLRRVKLPLGIWLMGEK